MKTTRPHRKVWIAWGRWWAVQLMWNRYFSLGVHIDFSRPYVDLYVWVFTATIGNNPVVTDVREKNLNRCRGFIFADDPVL